MVSGSSSKHCSGLILNILRLFPSIHSLYKKTFWGSHPADRPPWFWTDLFFQLHTWTLANSYLIPPFPMTTCFTPREPETANAENRSSFVFVPFLSLPCRFRRQGIVFLPCRFRRQGIVFFVFLSSSGNTSTANNFNISWLISTKLGHNNPYLRGIVSHDQQGVKGHVGVRLVKKVIFH